MDGERPLGTFSDELDRVVSHIDERIEAMESRADERQSETQRRLDGLTDQVTKTNGSVRELQRWRSYMEGVKAGAGGSWHVLVGGAGVLIGAASLVAAFMVAFHH